MSHPPLRGLEWFRSRHRIGADPEAWSWYNHQRLLGPIWGMALLRRQGLTYARLDRRGVSEQIRAAPVPSHHLPEDRPAAARRVLALAFGPEGAALTAALPDLALLLGHAHGVPARWVGLRPFPDAADLLLDPRPDAPGRPSIRPSPELRIRLPDALSWKIRLALTDGKDQAFGPLLVLPPQPEPSAHDRLEARARLGLKDSPLPPEILDELGIA